MVKNGASYTECTKNGQGDILAVTLTALGSLNRQINPVNRWIQQ